jgi:hypothetical protein
MAADLATEATPADLELAAQPARVLLDSAARGPSLHFAPTAVALAQVIERSEPRFAIARRRLVHRDRGTVTTALGACAIAAMSVADGTAQAAFPGANGRIAYGVWGAAVNSRQEIHTVRADGTDDRRLPLRGEVAHPTWSADGRMLAFNRVYDGGIWTARADGGAGSSEGAAEGTTTTTTSRTRPSTSPVPMAHHTASEKDRRPNGHPMARGSCTSAAAIARLVSYRGDPGSRAVAVG